MDINERLIQLEDTVNQLQHNIKVILDTITKMKIENSINYIKSKQDIYTVMFIPAGMKDQDLISNMDRHFTSHELANYRIKFLAKSSIHQDQGKWIVVLGSLDTRNM